MPLALGESGRIRLTRSRRRRSLRHRPRAPWKRLIHIVGKLTFGLMLVGCSTIPGLRLNRGSDPITTIQSGAMGDKRIEAYRELAKGDSVPAEVQATARQMLLDGAKNEYNVLAREAAVRGLGAHSGPDVLEALSAACNDKSPIVRVAACRALHEQKDPAVTASLARLATTDPEPDVRIDATGALMSSTDPAAVNALLECLKDEELVVAQRAAEGLRKMTGAPITGQNYAEWKGWIDGSSSGGVQNVAEKPARSGLFDIFRR